MQLVGALASPTVTGLEPQPGKSHYLYGNDPAAWRTGIPHYAKVIYEDVFRGVDLVYYGKQRQLAYDFIIAPGANPDQIKLTFQGVDALRRDKRGNLLVESGGQQFEFQRPYIYQVVDGVRRKVPGGFEVSSGNLIGFRVDPYDNSLPLVIDPVLSYSTYVGGTDFDTGTGIAVGTDGSVYVAGSTGSANFPTENPLQPTLVGGGLFHSDGFVLKLNTAGTGLVYATYFGGSEDDIAAGIAVDSQGNAYITGSTRSPDFPLIEAAQPSLTGTSAGRAPSPLMPNPATKVAMQQLAGTEARSFWGWNQIYTMVTKKPGPDPFQLLPPKPDGKPWKRKAIKKYNLTLDQWWALVTQPPSGTRSFWEWNHYYQQMTGRPGPDPYQVLSAKADGRAWRRKEINNQKLTADQWWAVASQPAHPGDGQAANVGVGSAFMMKLNPQGSGWVYSTYLGGSGNDQGADIAVDAEGNVYVAGVTTSPDFPVKNALQPVHGGGTQPFDPLDGFVAKLNATGSEVVFATYLGGSEDDLARGIALDSRGNPYVTGATLSTNFPVTVDVLQDELAGVYDAFVSKLQADGAAMLYSTFLVIHFTLVGGRVLGSNVSVGQCLTENQLFDESVEDLAYVAGLSTVEAKGEFVEVALEMHFTHLPLVSRSQPALQQRGNQVNMREFLGCQPRVSRRVGDPVAVAGFLQAPVTPPAVGMDQTAWLHTVAHKTHQTRARCVGDMAQTDPPHSAAFQFHRNHNQGFAHKLSPANVLLLAAQVSLVDLDTSAQPFPSQPNHRLPQLLQHQPGRLIAAQTEFTLQTLSAQPCFLGAGQPHCQKPTPQRHPRVVQDGSRSGRGLASAGATEHRASPRRPTLPGRAVRTNESRGPADADQILATGLLAGKPFSELHQMLWKVLAQLPRSSPPTARVQG